MRIRSILKTITLRVLLPAAALLLSAATAGAQTETVKFSGKQLTAREAFSQIKVQTGYAMAYNGRLFDANRTVSLTATDLPLGTAMKQILEDTGFSCNFYHNVISVTKDAADPVKKVTVVRERKPVTSDVYRRNSLADVNVASRRRPQSAPVQTAEPAHVGVQVDEQPHYVFTSHGHPVAGYARNQGSLPRVALKTNLLYWATATPNLALEIGLGRRTSLELSGSYNPWDRTGSLESNKKLVHMVLRPEFRWWLCERYNGHFFGAHAIYARYNIGSHDIPLLFKKEYRYDGHAVGGGVSYGYHWAFARRWGLEFSVGVGAMWLKYDRYDCAACDRDAKPLTKTYFGPTNAAINLVFLIK